MILWPCFFCTKLSWHVRFIPEIAALKMSITSVVTRCDRPKSVTHALLTLTFAEIAVGQVNLVDCLGPGSISDNSSRSGCGCVGWGQLVGQCVISWPQQRAQNSGTEPAGRLLLLGSWLPLRTVTICSLQPCLCESPGLTHSLVVLFTFGRR